MAAALRTLDVNLTQVLIDFFEDEFNWHHRLLVVALGGASWICVTPDLQVETVDLSAHRVLPLRRYSAFPPRAHDTMYIFDPISDQDLVELQRECLALARVLGVVNATISCGVVAGEWYISDTAHDDFGKKVDDADMASADDAVVRDDVGLLNYTDLRGMKAWTTVARVKAEDYDDWKDKKQSGPGRDVRIASNFRDSAGNRMSALQQSVNVYRDTVFVDWPFRGPKAIKELLTGVMKSGQELSTYDLFWKSRSGIARNSAIAITHQNIFGVLFLLQSCDQVDLFGLAAAEYLARWALMIQQATRKNPKAPVFTGLDHYLSHTFDETGGVVTSDFSQFIASEQRAEAQVLKQQRLWAEEQEKDDDRRTKGGVGGGGGGHDTNKKKKNNSGGGTDAAAAS